MTKLASSKIVASVFVTLAGLTPAWSQISSTTSDGPTTTSNSIRRIFVQNDKDRVQQFVDQNFERLQEAAAKGSGIILSDYIHLLGCRSSNGFLNNAIKQNYSRLFNHGKSEVVRQTEMLIENDAELSLACEAQS